MSSVSALARTPSPTLHADTLVLPATVERRRKTARFASNDSADGAAAASSASAAAESDSASASPSPSHSPSRSSTPVGGGGRSDAAVLADAARKLQSHSQQLNEDDAVAAEEASDLVADPPRLSGPATTAALPSRHPLSPKAYLQPSRSLQRQVAQAQQAAIELAKKMEAERARAAAAEGVAAAQPIVSASPSASSLVPSAASSSSLPDLECMQVWGRITSVLSLGQPGDIAASAVSSDGRLVATASGRSIHVWRQPGSEHWSHLNHRAHSNVAHQAPIKLLRFTPYSAELEKAHPETGGFMLLSSAEDLHIVIWSLSTRRAERVLQGGHRDLVTDAQFSARAANLLFTSSADGNVLVWDWGGPLSSLAEPARLLGSYARETSGIFGFALLEECSKMIVGAMDGTAGFWDLASHARLGRIAPDAEWSSKWRAKHGPTNGGWIDGQRFHTGVLHAIALTTDGTTLATGSADATVKVWSVLSLRRDTSSMAAAERMRGELAKRAPHIIALDPSAHSQRSDLDGEEAPMDTGFHGSLLLTLRHQSPVRHLHFTPGDGSFLVSAAEDQTVRVWITETGALVYQLNLPLSGAPILDVRLSFDARNFSPLSLADPREKYFYIARMHVTLGRRILAMDLAVLESKVAQAQSAATATAKEGDAETEQQQSRSSSRRSKADPAVLDGSANVWPSAASTAKPSKRSKKPLRPRPAAPAGPQNSVASDALVNQFLPGVAKLRAALAQGCLDSSSLSSQRAAVVASQLNFAPTFLHQLLQSPSGSSVDRAGLLANMHHFCVSATLLLRLLSQARHFLPLQILQAFARPQPECHPIVKAALAGLPVDAAMVDMGFVPSRSPGAAGAEGSASASTASLADPAHVFDSLAGVSAAAGPGRGAGGGGDLRFIEMTPSGSALGVAEGFFYSSAEPQALLSQAPAPALSAGSHADFNADDVDDEEDTEQRIVHWDPATQLNLLAHITSNTSMVAPIHATRALDPSHLKYSLFSLSAAEVYDQKERLEKARKHSLQDPYGGLKARRERDQRQHDAAEAERIARAPPSNGSKTTTSGGTLAAEKRIHRGNTHAQTKLLSPSAAASSFVTNASPASAASPRALLAPAPVAADLFATIVSGQVVPNGLRVDHQPQQQGAQGASTARGARRRLAAAAGTAASGSQTERSAPVALVSPRRLVQPRSEEDAESKSESFSGRTYQPLDPQAAQAAVDRQVASFSAARCKPLALNALLNQFSASDIEAATLANNQRLRQGAAAVTAQDEAQLHSMVISAAGGVGLGVVAAPASSKSSQPASASSDRLRSIRDGEFRHVLRSTLLHATNSLSALDTEFGSSSTSSGSGEAGMRGGGGLAGVKPFTHAQQQMVAPFGGSGSSGLTLPAHPSAHSLVGRGLAQTWKTHQASFLAGSGGGGSDSGGGGAGGIKGASEEPSNKSSLPLHGGVAAVRAAAAAAAASTSAGQHSHRRAQGAPVRSADPSATPREDDNPFATKLFSADAAGRGLSSLTAAAPGAVPHTTPLSVAYPSSVKHKWINKFSADVPGLDVIFDLHAPVASIGMQRSPSVASSVDSVSAVSATAVSATSPAPAPSAVATPTAELSSPLSPTSKAKHGRRAGTDAQRSASDAALSAAVLPLSARRAGSKKSAATEIAAAISEPPPPPPDAVRVAQSDAVLTRPFMLRQQDASAATAPTASSHASGSATASGEPLSLAERISDGLMELGLDQLPDLGALQTPVRVDLAAAEAMHTDAHASMHLTSSDS